MLTTVPFPLPAKRRDKEKGVVKGDKSKRLQPSSSIFGMIYKLNKYFDDCYKVRTKKSISSVFLMEVNSDMHNFG